MRPRLHRGFTLLELIIAMMLLALMSSLLYGTLSLSAGSWDKGEAKAVQSADMRLTEEFLRQSLTAQHPLRMHKVAGQPLYFPGNAAIRWRTPVCFRVAPAAASTISSLRFRTRPTFRVSCSRACSPMRKA